MFVVRAIFAYLLASVLTVLASTSFYTQQVIAKQVAIGAVYTPAQQLSTYLDNFFGLAFAGAPSFGVVVAVALLIGFAIAFVLKRVLRPLAPLAYPLAGAAATAGVIYLINNVVAGGGTGAIGGARDAAGMALQALAGGLGGLAFALLRPRG